MGRLDVDVCDAAAFLGQRFVLVRRLGELGDDVPGVEETGDEAQTAEEDVDDGVSAANAALYPDRKWGKEDCQQAEEDVCGAHGCAK